MAEIFTLQSHQILDNWHWIEHFLERIDDPGWKTLDVQCALLDRHAQLWGMVDHDEYRAIWITRIENTGSTRWGLVWIAAGEGLEEGLELFREYTEPWFREMGCEYVQILGRKGWMRALPDYSDKGVILVKQL